MKSSIILSVLAVLWYNFDKELDGINYKLYPMRGVATVIKGADSDSVIIPSTISYNSKNYVVTSIGDSAFFNCTNSAYITIPKTTKYIGNSAFEHCSNLSAIDLPESVISIGRSTFSNCNRLTSITIPNSVTSIGDYAFYHCSSLKEVRILSLNVEMGGGDVDMSQRIQNLGYNNVFNACSIDNLYCTNSIDLSKVGGTIKHVYRVEDKDSLMLKPFSIYAQEYVETRINKWQQKGEFEKTVDWNKRVNEITLQQKVNEFFNEAKRDYLATYTKWHNYQFALSSYDPDNEVYLVTDEDIGNLLVPVPIKEAPSVRAKWSSCFATPHYAFAGTDIIVESVDFTFPNKKTYTYKSTENLTYAQADIQYNFDPIDLNLGAASSSSQPKGQQTIQQKQVTIGKSAVDTNIPVTNTKNANTFVVIIANENYQSVAKVPFANNDGEILSQYCNKTLGIPTDNIHIYKDATYNNMRSAIAWLETVCRSYDGTASVIFYYTGHGIPDESNKTAYLLPVDGDGKYVQSGIALDEVYSKLGAMPSKSITVLLDACFSGATRDGAMLASAKGVAIRVKKGTPLGNTVALTAAQGDETAGFYEEQGHGLFTYFLLKKLQETKGDVTLEQLSNYITTEVKRRSAVQGKIQTPSITPSSSLANDWQNWKLK